MTPGRHRTGTARSERCSLNALRVPPGPRPKSCNPEPAGQLRCSNPRAVTRPGNIPTRTCRDGTRQAAVYSATKGAVYAKAHQTGGHFVPWENPEAFVEDVRETFRKLR